MPSSTFSCDSHVLDNTRAPTMDDVRLRVPRPSRAFGYAATLVGVALVIVTSVALHDAPPLRPHAAFKVPSLFKSAIMTA